MYTPRSLGNLIKHALDAAEKLPVSNTEVYEAEWSYSIDQLEFLKTEFRSLCKGLDICLQSFTGKPLEWKASDLYRHLKGLIGNGQVKLKDGVLHDANEAVALARFLFRIGFFRSALTLKKVDLNA